MKVAIVHDDFIQRGGAEKLVLAMLEIWPRADLYGVLATQDWQFERRSQSHKEIKTSFLQRLPLKRKFFSYYYALYPLAVESFKFDDYDLVISSSARYAHGVITKPKTLHLAYVNSPARFLYEEEFRPHFPLFEPVIAWHRAWDEVAAKRPDYLIANSKSPAEKIEKFWQRKVDAIIYPFVDWEKYQPRDRRRFNPQRGLNPYFLVVSRLKRWKNIDLAVKVCNKLRFNLKIVGRGEDEWRLRRLNGPTIEFLGFRPAQELVSLYQNCQALIMTQEEDFGITALEAQACGKPVIAYGRGGALETVIEGKTGIFFKRQTKESLEEVLAQFDPRAYLRENCLHQAQKFGKDRFKKELSEFVENALREA